MKIFVFLLLVFLDYYSKKLIFNLIDLNNIITLLPFIDIIHIHNYGISFGLFSEILQPWTIILIGIIVSIIIFVLFLRISNQIEKWGFLFILIGAVSNLGDRIINNYVLDFIYIHYKDFYWPAFNFADVYITIGVLIIIYENYRIFKSTKKKLK